MPDPKEQFEELVAGFADEPGVGLPGAGAPRRFGSDALTVDGSIFAMLMRGELVVKVPRQRVAELIRQGTGRPFDSGKGTPMKEWVSLPESAGETWVELAEEAYTFVRSRPGRR